jgi:Carboxypeptidase regulatory-like domain
MALFAWAALLLPATADAGTVMGSVTPLDWAQEVEVCAVEKQPSELCTTAGADGSYVLQNVPLGAVRIEFIPSFRSRLLTQYYDHKSRLNEATTFFLTSAEPTAAHIDADLIEGGVIEGTVTSAGSGLPLSEVEVCAVSASVPVVKRCEETGANGTYELHSLPSESYRVVFRGRGKSVGYQPQYYDHEHEPAQSDFISVSAGATTSNIDATLEPGAEVAGAVADSDGVPLPGIAVCLFDATASAADRCTYSSETGSYAFPGLPSGSYQVGFSLESWEAGIEAGVEADGYESQYFDGVGSRAEATTISALAPAVVSGVNARLSPPPQPSPVPPSSAAASSLVAAPPVIAEPRPPAKRCKKGFRKKKVKGKVRCHRRRGKRR